MSESKKVEKKETKPIAPGEYVAMLDNYVETDNKAKNGRRATLDFVITQKDSEFVTRHAFLDLNPVLPSAKKENPDDALTWPERIARDKINEFLKATGEAPEGLESLGNDRSKIITFKGDKVVLVIDQEVGKSYTNRNGIKVVDPIKTVIKKIKPV